VTTMDALATADSDANNTNVSSLAYMARKFYFNQTPKKLAGITILLGTASEWKNTRYSARTNLDKNASSTALNGSSH
jgi:hypothetical protein